MRIPLVRIAGACVALLVSLPSRAQEEGWPAAMLELEKLALQNPRRNAAFAHLQQLAAESGRLDEWRTRWETRARAAGGAAESLMLGWLEIEAGRAKEARACFTRAAELAQENPHALLAHAESLLRAGNADGESLARRAAELFTDAADKAGALRLAAVIAQEKGEFAAAWEHLSQLEGRPLDAALRVALMPDFARAHLALRDWEAWSAALLESSEKSAADAAAGVSACLALGDPATAHSVVVQALKRDPADALLQRLAITAASIAGFSGDAAARIEASLGAQPAEDDLAEAINSLAALGAPEHARRIFSRHAAQLAPIAARWRQPLPLLWRHGGTEGLRDLLVPHADAGGWELQLALGELAIMEKDTAAAEHALWRLFAREFDAHEIASTARALAAVPVRNPLGIPIAGQGFATRLSEMEQQFESVPVVFRPVEKTAGTWWVNSLADARDIALCYLRRLASDAGGDAPEKFLAVLRGRTAHWPPGDRLLAFSAVGNPAGMLDAADAVAGLAAPSRELRNFARTQIARVRVLPALPPELVTKAAAIAKRIPAAEPAPRAEGPVSQSWHARLLGCWRLFDEGKFREADTAFTATLHDFAADGTGPDTASWASFHASLISSADTFPDDASKMEAAAHTLRWLGMQTPRRADWPAAAQPRMLCTEYSATSMQVMFKPPRQTSSFVVATGRDRYFGALGGSVPSDLLTPLYFFTLHFRKLDQPRLDEALAMKLRDLPEECARTALLARGAAAAIGGHAHEDPAWRERLLESADAPAALLAAASSALAGGGRDPGVAAAELLKAVPDSLLSRAAWFTAALHMMARDEKDSDPLPTAAKLSILPADAHTRRAARAAVETLASRNRADAADLRALSGRLAQAWPAGDEADSLPGECEARLRTLVNSAEADAAAALARKILAQPPEIAARSPEQAAMRREAVRTLDATGEIAAWFTALRKSAGRDKPSDMRRLADAAGSILQTVKPAETPRVPDAGRLPNARRKPAQTGGLDASLLRDAGTALREAELRLVHLEPEDTAHWTALVSAVGSSRSMRAEDRTMPVIAIETLLRAAHGGLSPQMALRFTGDDPEVIADLAARWPARAAGGQPRENAEIAARLWRAGKKDAAVDWLQKMPGTDPFGERKRAVPSFLIEALAVGGDASGVVDALASTLVAAVAPAPAIGAFPKRDRWGPVADERRPLAAMLDEAHALGLGIALAEKLEANPAPGASAVALLQRARERDAAALPAISARLAQPLMPLLLEEFAEQLAEWREGREAAQAALRALEPAHALLAPSHRALQLAHHGWLAAHSGMEREAVAWLDEALVRLTATNAPRLEILLTAAEGLSRAGEKGKARAAADSLAKLFATGSWDSSLVAARLRELATEGDAGTVRMLSDALLAKGSPRDTNLPAAITDATRILEIRDGRTAGLTPFAWVRARQEDGTGEIAWALGYFSQGQENARMKRVPNFFPDTPLRDSRIEIFHGTAVERLERLAVIEDAKPVGLWRGRIPQPGGHTAATLSAGTASVLGPPLRASEGEDLLPATAELPGRLLPALIWKKRAAGPDGDAIASAHKPSQGSPDGDLFGAARIELPGTIGKDLVISGWARHEMHNQMNNVALMVLRATGDGRWAGHHFIPGGALGGDWQHFEFKISAAENAQHAVKPGDAPSAIALQLLPGCAYSGLRVTATVPKKDGDGVPRR